MSLSKEFSAAQSRTQRKQKRARFYQGVCLVMVLILIVSAGITFLLGGFEAEEELAPPSTAAGVATGILAPLPMQGGAASTAVYLPAIENTTVRVWDASVIRQPESGQVDVSYFADAAFVGDSLTEGFIDYKTNLGGALICGYSGIGPNSIVNKSVVSHNERGDEVALDVLAAHQPKKVYILLGRNTLVTLGNDDSFLQYYSAMIDLFYETLGSDVCIYIQGIPPITQAAMADGYEGLDSPRLLEINEKLALLAVEKGTAYIDLWEAFADDTGYLRAEYAAADGMHFTAGDGYATWVKYLRTHTVYDASNPWTAGSSFAV